MFDSFRRLFLGSTFLLLPFLFTSCALFDSFENPDIKPNEPVVLEPTKFKILLIDTPRVKFYDFASLRYNKSNKNLSIELYKLGKPVSKLTITQKDICIDKECTPKWIAAKGFFGDVSYPALFSDIINAQDIFDGDGKRVANNGAFVQWFIRGGQEFYYERSKNKVLFKNLTLNITIGIEDYIIPKD